MRFALFCVSTMLLAGDPALPLVAPPTRVRLHPDEAWVTRVGRMPLGKGTHRLCIADLPPGLGLDDVRVAAMGPEGLQLGDLALDSALSLTRETQGWKDMQTEVESIQERLDHLAAERAALEPEIAFLKGLLASQEKEQAKQLTTALPSAQALVELSKGLQGRLTEALARKTRVERDMAKRQEALTRLKAELSKRESERRQGPTRVTVEVTVVKAGDVTLELTTRTRQARWEPAYEARLSPDGANLDLVLFAAVRQKSGEDWRNVTLEVSNVRTSRNLDLPLYDSGQSVGWYTHEHQGSRGGSPTVAVEVVASSSRASMDNAQASYTQATPVTFAPPPSPNSARELEATRRNEGHLGVTFRLEGSKDVLADGEPSRFRILTVPAEHSLVVVATPRLDPTAFQVARFPNPKGLPLFPGAPLVQFLGTQRLGQCSLILPELGKPFQLSFGPYRSVRVSLDRVNLQKETVGLLSKDRQWTLEERIDILSEAPNPVDVEIYDRLLTPADNKVRITQLPPTETPTELHRQVAQWKLRLEPGKTKTIPLKTQIRGPENGVLSGLEGLGLQ